MPLLAYKSIGFVFAKVRIIMIEASILPKSIILVFRQSIFGIIADSRPHGLMYLCDNQSIWIILSDLCICKIAELHWPLQLRPKKTADEAM